MAWLLQVLDARIFADLKRPLTLHLARARARCANGNVDVAAWINVASETVTNTLIHASPQNHFAQH
eukprot:1772801-Alexandrium_andersonii.AAC.1